ncbi:MAG: alpha/beta fold hydrolase [Deltaproteobacteria bacterium]|jgi:predicted alpha/beta-fold hydrolase|nr:alpha/beta fold hydrolase [Deltaproteobacteria bacterium]
MPVLAGHTYKAPWWLPGGDAQTVWPRILRFVPRLPFMREELSLDDGDFIFVDWLLASGRAGKVSQRLVILSHGLEGDSGRSYMRAMAAAFLRRGWDVAARNFRGCGGRMNRRPVLYHSGEVGDMDAVVRHAENLGYGTIALVGFSMGGNQVLKYLGERAQSLPASVVRGVGISTPCDLTGSSLALARPRNRPYMEYFLRTLRRKMREKHDAYPELFPLEGLEAIRDFKQFDDAFTAPLNGFADAEDYWRKASCLPYLGRVAIPALVLNARNDPFLSGSCYPVREAGDNPKLFLLMPETGGHVGFPTWTGRAVGWLEEAVADFCAS